MSDANANSISPNLCKAELQALDEMIRLPAQSFYRGLGATEDPEWRRWIMPTDALNRLVEGAE
jgi:hypothetical protein